MSTFVDLIVYVEIGFGYSQKLLKVKTCLVLKILSVKVKK